MTERKYDVAILGAGPGGYPPAIRLAQAGKRVALIERDAVGGTCLNRGCIPTKALIANAEAVRTIKRAAEYGIRAELLAIDYAKMAQGKSAVVAKLHASLEGLIAANHIDLIHGVGSFTAPNEIKVIGKDSCRIRAQDIIIATGSEPREIAAFPFDNTLIHSSTSILALEQLPRSLVVVGGGVIGCEFASLFAELGVQVSVVELLPRILPLECESVSTFLEQSFKKRGIQVHTGAEVQRIDKVTGKDGAKHVEVVLKNNITFAADMALVAIGRSLNSSSIGLDRAGVVVERGVIPVNDVMQTNVLGIYAVGDVTGKAMYAHVATHQGFVAAAHILGAHMHMNYDAVPGVIFTHPEIGTVGMCFEAAKARGYAAKKVAYPFQALGKAQAAKETEGFAQIIIDETTGQILGAQVVGHEASSLIAPLTYAITHELTVEAVADTIHAHPTLSEIWFEAAMIGQGTPLHFM